MSAAIQELNRHFIDLWRQCDTGLPDLGLPYTAQAQGQNEKRLLQFMEQVEYVLAHPPRGREEVESTRLLFGTASRRLAVEILGLTGTQLDLLPSQAFSDASEDFMRQARAFDSRLSMMDIYQAGRNAWTACGLQWLLGLPVQLTPSIFAYSLLYPYTDNYLDDPAIAGVAKQAFNEKLSRRLAGRPLAPANARERAIFDLVGRIEKQYSRSKHAAVYESLSAIHDAQSQSLNLLRGAPAPGEVDILGLSFYKGGTSVLADGWLVSSSLSTAQRQYTYGHGVLAQLLDDLEDVGEDIQAGRLTIFSQPADHGSRDALASRAFQMGRAVLKGLDCFDVDESVRELVRRGADLLLIEAVGRTDGYYTPPYAAKLETYSPFRFSFLKERRHEFIKRHAPLEKLAQTLLLRGMF